jgi:hypothetical protein
VFLTMSVTPIPCKVRLRLSWIGGSTWTCSACREQREVNFMVLIGRAGEEADLCREHIARRSPSAYDAGLISIGRLIFIGIAGAGDARRAVRLAA